MSYRINFPFICRYTLLICHQITQRKKKAPEAVEASGAALMPIIICILIYSCTSLPAAG